MTTLTSIPAAVPETQLPNLPAFLQGVQLGLVPAILAASGSAGAARVPRRVGPRPDERQRLSMSTFALLMFGLTVMVNGIDVTRGGRGVFAIPRRTSPAWRSSAWRSSRRGSSRRSCAAATARRTVPRS